MAWITPKTDWKAQYDAAGSYAGDYFDYEDYNRIKNNLKCVYDLALEFVGVLPSISFGPDKHVPNNNTPDFQNDNFFASEFNAFEEALEAVATAMNRNYGTSQTFYDNGKFIGYAELNRIESATLDLYDLLVASIQGKMRLAIRFGMRAHDVRP